MNIILLTLLILPINIIPKNVLPKTQIVFSDSNYSQATHNFSFGQTVYIKIENSGCGCSQKTLRVLDNGKNEINKLDLNRTGDGPYVFTASFSAPSAEGIYYVDIKIGGSGSSYSNQQNINVTGGGNVSISTITPTPKPTIVWKPTATSTLLSPTPGVSLASTKFSTPIIHNFWQQFIESIQQWLGSLTNKF